MDVELAFILKGSFAVAGLVLLIWHMLTTQGPMLAARLWRYIALLAASGSVAFASQEQVRDEVSWEPRQWGGVLIVVTVIVAAILSLREDRRTTLSQTKGSDHDQAPE